VNTVADVGINDAGGLAFKESTRGRAKRNMACRIVGRRVGFRFHDHSANAIPVEMCPDHIPRDIKMMPIKELDVEYLLLHRQAITA